MRSQPLLYLLLPMEQQRRRTHNYTLLSPYNFRDLASLEHHPYQAYGLQCLAKTHHVCQNGTVDVGTVQLVYGSVEELYAVDLVLLQQLCKKTIEVSEVLNLIVVQEEVFFLKFYSLKIYAVLWCVWIGFFFFLFLIELFLLFIIFLVNIDLQVKEANSRSKLLNRIILQ